jgi:hypothetical protein
MGQRGFTDARDVLDQQVPLCEQTCQAQADLVLLAQDDLVQLRKDGRDFALRRAQTGSEGGRELRKASTRAICALN